MTRFVVESCFERAEEFIPERWSSRPELVKDSSAFAPFNQGKDSPGVPIILFKASLWLKAHLQIIDTFYRSLLVCWETASSRRIATRDRHPGVEVFNPLRSKE